MIKLFSQDPGAARDVGAASGDAIKKIAGRRRRARTASRTPSAARRPCSRWIPRWPRAPASRRRRSNWTPAPSCRASRRHAPVVVNDRAYTIRVRFPAIDARVARCHREHAARQLDRAGPRRSARWPRSRRLPGQTEIRRENLQRDVAVTARLEGVDLGTGIAAVQKTVAGSASAAVDPRRVRRHLRGAAEIVPRSAVRAAAGDRAGLHRAAVRVRQLRRADRDPLVGAALDLGRVSRAARDRAPRSTCRRSWA